jgi:DNA-binding CsgD family transcriptional regulator
VPASQIRGFLNQRVYKNGRSMKSIFENYCKRLDQGVDSVRSSSRHFCKMFDLTGFAYVRVYHDGRVGWVTSDADHDRMLIEKGYLKSDPLIDTAKLLKEGKYLWFHDRIFPGSDSFYHDRKQFFAIDHGLVIVNHQKNYLETGCFSGYLAKRPLYNIFLQEIGLFREFLYYFSQDLSPLHKSLLEEGMRIEDLKVKSNTPMQELLVTEREELVTILGYSEFLRLSKQERNCLNLLAEYPVYDEVARKMELSYRTVEHYLESAKIKLGIDHRLELFAAARKLKQLGL